MSKTKRIIDNDKFNSLEHEEFVHVLIEIPLSLCFGEKNKR